MSIKKTNKIVNFSDYVMKNNYTYNNIKKNNNKIKNKNKVLNARIEKKSTNPVFNVIIFIIFLCAIICFCLFSPMFKITNIEVFGKNVAYISENLDRIDDLENTELEQEGQSHYTIDEIVQMSGVIIGKNIFQENTKKIKENLLKASYIKDVSIIRKFPSTIKIVVEERMILAYVDYVGSYICIDNEGFVVDIINKNAKQEDIAIIKGILPKDIVKGFNVGEVLDAEDIIKVERIITLFKLLEKNEIILNIEMIDITNVDELMVYIEKGNIKINCGNMSDMNLKMIKLPEILKNITGKKGILYMGYRDEKDNPRFAEEF